MISTNLVVLAGSDLKVGECDTPVFKLLRFDTFVLKVRLSPGDGTKSVPSVDVTEASKEIAGQRSTKEC